MGERLLLKCEVDGSNFMTACAYESKLNSKYHEFVNIYLVAILLTNDSKYRDETCMSKRVKSPTPIDSAYRTLG